MEKNALEVYNSFLPNAKHWVQELDYYSKSQFKRVPEGCELSIGQVYDSLIQVSYHFFMKNALDCAYGRGVSNTGEKTFKGWALFYVKGFFYLKPTLGYEYVPKAPEGALGVKDEMYKFLKLIYKVAQEIDTKKPQGKLLHPVFGYLSALEWLTLVAKHFEAMRKVKIKIDKSVRSKYIVDELEEQY
jgi:hypothetical protein